MTEPVKVLVTGGAGFLGSHTARRLMDMGAQVTIFDFFHQYIFPIAPSYLENMQYRFANLVNGAEVLRVNINNKEDLRRKVLQVKPNVVVHLAALPLANIARWQTEEAFDGIINASFNMIDVLADVPGVRKFVYVSSSMVYGDFTQIPMPEDGKKDPKDIYGGMKLAGEFLMKVFAKNQKIPYVIIRPSAVYGPTDNNRRVLQNFVESAIQGKPLEVTDPDHTFLDFTFVEDTAQGLALAALSPKSDNEEFNITRGEGRNLTDALNILRKMFPKLVVRPKDVDEKFRPARGTLDIGKARRLLGYNPAFSLEDGLARYVDYVKKVNVSLTKS